MHFALKKPSERWLLLFAANILFRNRIRRCQFLQQSSGRGAAFFADFIMRPLTFLPTLHNARLNQNLHVIRKPRLSQVQLFQQYAGAFFAAAKQFENPQTFFITKCLEHSRVLLINRCQPITSYQFYLIYHQYMRQIKFCQYEIECLSHISQNRLYGPPFRICLTMKKQANARAVLLN